METTSNFQTFTYTVPATPVAVNFFLGGMPSRVEIINKGNASGICARAIWQSGMPDASAFTQITDGTAAFKSADGITPSDALTIADSSDTQALYSAQGRDQFTITQPPGFTLGTLSAFNVASCIGDTLYITAWVGPSGQ